MATLVVTVAAADGTTQQLTAAVTISAAAKAGFYPGTNPGSTTFPGKATP